MARRKTDRVTGECTCPGPCGRRVRPRGTTLAMYPGTVLKSRKEGSRTGFCVQCWAALSQEERDERDAAQLARRDAENNASLTAYMRERAGRGAPTDFIHLPPVERP